QAERLRDQGHQHADGDAPRDALGDQGLELVHERRDFQNEREDQQRQEQRRQDFANQVAIEDFHGRESQDNRWTTSGGGWPGGVRDSGARDRERLRGVSTG